jgi:photosystem I subunit 4
MKNEEQNMKRIIATAMLLLVGLVFTLPQDAEALEPGSKVRVVKVDSFWYADVGDVVYVDRSGILYPELIIVRFENVGQSSGSNGEYDTFSPDDLEEVSKEDDKDKACNAK